MNGAQLGVAKEPLIPPKEGGLRGFFVTVRPLFLRAYELTNSRIAYFRTGLYGLANS